MEDGRLVGTPAQQLLDVLVDLGARQQVDLPGLDPEGGGEGGQQLEQRPPQPGGLVAPSSFFSKVRYLRPLSTSS